jgi:hypothetical protein
MDELIEYRGRLLDRFERIPADLAQRMKKIALEDLHTPMMDSTWSPHRLLAHLRNSESQTFLPRFRQILGKDGPGAELFNNAARSDETYDAEEPLDEILQTYAQMRLLELEWLKSMPPGGWSWTGRHLVFGLRTLQWWVERSLVHAEQHLRELQKNIMEN